MMNYFRPWSLKSTVLLLLYVGVLWFLSSHSSMYIDDEFIYFRYVENLLRGHGLTYNRGSLPVEGYTSTTYLLILALGTLLFGSLEISAWVINFLAAAATILLTAMVAYELRPRFQPIALLAPLPLLLDTDFLSWTRAPFDTMLATAVMTALALAVIRDPPLRRVRTNLLFFVGCLTRPEVLILYPVFAMLRPVMKPRTETNGTSPYFPLMLGLGLTALFVIWRTWYFGYPFPNTYYAKTGARIEEIQSGLSYVWRFLSEPQNYLHWVALLLLPRAMGSMRVRAAIAFVGAYGAIIVFEGGDSQPYWRFLLYILPLWTTLAILSLDFVVERAGRLLHRMRWNTSAFRRHLGQRFSRLLPYGTMLAVVFLFCLMRYHSELGKWCKTVDSFMNTTRSASELRDLRTRLLREFWTFWWIPSGTSPETSTYQYTLVGKWLADNFPSSTVVATSQIGAIAYYSKLPIVDMFGLTDPNIAHSKIDSKQAVLFGRNSPAYYLKRRPDLFVLGYEIMIDSDLSGKTHDEIARRDGLFDFERELITSSEFVKTYVPAAVTLDVNPLGCYGKTINYFVRRDLIGGIRSRFPGAAE